MYLGVSGQGLVNSASVTGALKNATVTNTLGPFEVDKNEFQARIFGKLEEVELLYQQRRSTISPLLPSCSDAAQRIGVVPEVIELAWYGTV